MVAAVSLTPAQAGSVSVERRELVAALAFVKPMCLKGTMPILSDVRLTREGGKLVMRSTDLYVELETRIACDAGPSFDVVTPWKELTAQLKALDADAVTLTPEGTRLCVSDAGGSAYVEAIHKAEDWPASMFPFGKSRDVRPMSAERLSTALGLVMPCVSRDETRAHLNSVLFELCHAPGLYLARMVSTDGHRLAKHDIDPRLATDTPEECLVPRNAAERIASMVKGKGAADVSLTVGSGKMRASRGDRSITLRMVDAKFPPYGQIIPASGPTRLTVDRAALSSAAKALGTDERTRGITLDMSGGSCTVRHAACAGERVLAGATVEGTALKIGVNSVYVLQWLATLPKDVRTVSLAFGGVLDPIRSDDGGVTCIVMPMRI